MLFGTIIILYLSFEFTLYTFSAHTNASLLLYFDYFVIFLCQLVVWGWRSRGMSDEGVGRHKTRKETCMNEITKYFTSGREMV